MEYLDNRFYDSVIAEMQPFFDENGFKAQSDGSFLNEKKSAKIEYNEARQMYTLSIADVTDGNIGEYSEVSAWLFDDSQNAKDAGSVGVDFVGTLRENLGIKYKRPKITDIDLPSANKNGALTVSGFTKKVLDVYPQYKEAYKLHIAQYGNFLYLNFFSESLIPQIRTALTDNTKKTIKKLFELLEDGYVRGDRETVNAIVACVTAAIDGDVNLQTNALVMLDEDKHFKNSVVSFIPVFQRKKKLRNALLK